MIDYFKRAEKLIEGDNAAVDAWLKKRPIMTAEEAIKHDKRYFNKNLNGDQDILLSAAIVDRMASDYLELAEGIAEFERMVQLWIGEEEFEKLLGAFTASQVNLLAEECGIDKYMPMATFKAMVMYGENKD